MEGCQVDLLHSWPCETTVHMKNEGAWPNKMKVITKLLGLHVANLLWVHNS